MDTTEESDLQYATDETEFPKEKPDWNYINENPYFAIPCLMFLSVVMVMGTIGNIFVIGAVFASKTIKSNGSIFIVNLAIADLGVTAFVVPMSVFGIIEGEEWFKSRFELCEATASICLTICYCSLLSIGTISFNRYLHICHNNLYNRLFTFNKSLIIIILLWIIAFLLVLPNFIGWGDLIFDHKTLSCIWDRQADYSYTLFFVATGIGFPVTMISICYLKIFLHVRNSKRQIAALSQNGSSGMSATERANSMRLSRTLFVIFVTFVTCWTPYALIVAADVEDTLPIEMHTFTVLLAHINSSVNCILYGVTNRQFRRGYVKFLRFTKCGSYIADQIIGICCKKQVFNEEATQVTQLSYKNNTTKY